MTFLTQYLAVALGHLFIQLFTITSQIFLCCIFLPLELLGNSLPNWHPPYMHHISVPNQSCIHLITLTSQLVCTPSFQHTNIIYPAEHACHISSQLLQIRHIQCPYFTTRKHCKHHSTRHSLKERNLLPLKEFIPNISHSLNFFQPIFKLIAMFLQHFPLLLIR